MAQRSKVVRLPRKRAFQAAKIDMLRSDWPVWGRPPDADIRHGLRVLRARARHEAQNNDHVRGFLREVKSNVIGPEGVVLQNKARMRNGRPDKRAQTAVEDSWQAWGEVGECEVTGRLSWCDLQHQAIETIARDGECLYQLVEGWENRWSFALQALDPEALDVDYNAELANGNVVIMGVEMDAWRRPVAYHMLREDPLQRSYRTKVKRVAIPASQILHCYLPEWVWQTRGVPWAATALRRLQDLNGYDEAAVVAARAGASKMGFFEQSEDAMPLVNEDGDANPGVLADGQHSDGELYQSFEAGSMGVLPVGYSFTGWDPRYPHAEHGNFTKAVLRGVATGLGVAYNSWANDLEGVNYTSLRMSSQVEREIWKMIQKWLIGCFHTQVYRRWLFNALQMSSIVGPNGRPVDARRADEFERVAWQGRRWQWVDPAKEAAGAKSEIEMRTRSISSVIRERGLDPQDVWDEIAEERAVLAELGISPEAATAAAVGASTNVNNEDEEDDQENRPDEG